MSNLKEGALVSYKDFTGIIAFICEGSLSISIRSFVEDRSREVRIVVYCDQWHLVQPLLTDEVRSNLRSTEEKRLCTANSYVS
jgi:hypothetical protein